MKSSTRLSAVLLSTVALAAGALSAPAGAAYWSLFSGSTSQSQQSAPVSVAPSSAGDAPSVVASNAGNYRDGAYVGDVVDAYYGPLQVQASISGGRIASVKVLQYPADRRTSQRINSQALPELQSEVIAAQNTRVDIVSGATLTSEAYMRSLNSALGKAR
ncbi:MAG: FMN-binding protein [Bradyrhizobium sp.]|nr:MAG: FMN-binding protein [Bradyrhizobium sp.]